METICETNCHELDLTPHFDQIPDLSAEWEAADALFQEAIAQARAADDYFRICMTA